MKIGEAINKLNELERKLSKHDLELRNWLSLHEVSLRSNSEFLKTLVNNDKITNHVLKDGNSKTKDVATVIVHELKQYAGHTLNINGNKPTYPEILSDVHKRLCKDKKIEFIEAMTIQQREDEIARIILKISLETLTEDELEQIFSGMGIDFSKEKRSKIVSNAIAGGSVVMLTELLGKKVIKEFVLKTVENYVAKKVGKKVVEKVIGKLAKKLPQYFFKASANIVGAAFFAYDIYLIGGEATRVTTPMVLDIAINKSLSRLSAGSLKKSA